MSRSQSPAISGYESWDTFLSTYKSMLEPFLGVTLPDINNHIKTLDNTQTSEIISAFTNLFSAELVTKNEAKNNAQTIFALIKACYPSLLPNDDGQNFPTINDLQKSPRILKILDSIKKADPQIAEAFFVILKNLFNDHLLLPHDLGHILKLYINSYSTRSEHQSISSLLWEIINNNDVDSNSRIAETIALCFTSSRSIDNLSSFKLITGLNNKHIVTPLVGTETANIFYTSSPTYLNAGITTYFDLFPEQKNILAISAHNIPLAEINGLRTIPILSAEEEILYEKEKSYLMQNFSSFNVKTYSQLLQQPAEISLYTVTQGEQTLHLYQLPVIADLYYGNSLVQELISRALIKIEQDITEQEGFSRAPMIINCERGTNRSKAIYEAILELRFPEIDSEIKIAALESSLPENMTHFTNQSLDDYAYLGHGINGERINPYSFAMKLHNEAKSVGTAPQVNQDRNGGCSL